MSIFCPRFRSEADFLATRTKLIDAWDYGRIGRMIRIAEDEVRAVVDVETGDGSGFDSKRRLKMLFEPHVFYRELGEAKRAVAINAGIASRKWGEIRYPKDSYPRLLAAMKIDRTAALRSASWGLGQIMGFNHKLAGWASVDDMLTAFMADEENQLRGMINFIVTEHLDDELRRHDWAGFARGYNGAGYRQNQYDTKLAAAFAKWQGRADAE